MFENDNSRGMSYVAKQSKNNSYKILFGINLNEQIPPTIIMFQYKYAGNET
jgi:hypothetical protein